MTRGQVFPSVFVIVKVDFVFRHVALVWLMTVEAPEEPDSEVKLIMRTLCCLGWSGHS